MIQGAVTGASGRNWASYGHEVELGAGPAKWERDVLTDPQVMPRAGLGRVGLDWGKIEW